MSYEKAENIIIADEENKWNSWVIDENRNHLTKSLSELSGKIVKDYPVVTKKLYLSF